MKKIEKITKKIHGEYFLETYRFFFLLEEKSGGKKKYEYFRKIIYRIGKKEPISIIILEKSTSLISYGSVLLGLEELILIHKDDVFCEKLQKICDYLHQKNDEFAPFFMLKNIEKPCFFYTLKSGEEMVNLRGIAKDLGIFEDEVFAEAMVEVLESYDPLRFDGVRGSFFPKNEAMAVLELFHHYSGKKNGKLQEILENDK